MQAAANAPVFINANQNAPTVSSGTGGYLVSNQTDNHITVKGCMLNANSVQAVTGSGNGAGTPHTTNPSTGQVVFGVQWTSVDSLIFEDNEIYDPGTYFLAGANLSNFKWNDNQFVLPLPIVQSKNTNGPSIEGPDLNGEISGNIITAGDDSIDLSTEDTRTGTSYFTPHNWLWGPIQHIHVEHNTLVGSDNGIRLLDSSELIDDIDIGDTAGTTNGIALTVNQWPSFIWGPGNVGRVRVHGWKVATSGSYSAGGSGWSNVSRLCKPLILKSATFKSLILLRDGLYCIS